MLERHDGSDVARGGLAECRHGNVDLLSDDDARWMAKCSIVYEGTAVWKYFSIRGYPRQSAAYGYMASTEGGKLYTVVNASQEKAKVMLPEATGTGRVLFTDSGFMPVLEKNIVELGPEQMVVVGYGKFSTREYDLGIEKDIVIPATIQKVKIDVQKKNEHTLQAHYTPSKGKNCTDSLSAIG